MRTPITFPQLEAKVRELVATNPNFVYPRVRNSICVYNPTEGLPPCIFGEAFIALGYPIPLHCEGSSISEVLPSVLSGELTSANKLWADIMQAQQDSRNSWQVALEKADAKREMYLEEGVKTK